MGQVAPARGDVPRAAASFQNALSVAAEIENKWNIANAIAGAAAISAALGRDVRSAKLLDAADAAREAPGHPLLPQFRLFSQMVEVVRTSLGPDRFQSNWTTGRALDVEIAVAQSRAVFAAAHHTGGHG
jgi:hypothetical protein